MRLLHTDRILGRNSPACIDFRRSLIRIATTPPMIERVVEARPDRVIWGSNWPHPICPVPMPNDGDLVDLIPPWFPDQTTQRLALVENPAALYGFGT